MYTALATSYSTLESTLDALLTSITAHAPSPAAATALLTANATASTALRTLATHHANATTLAALRAESAALDAQLRATLTSLAAARAALKRTRLDAAHGREVGVAEVLAYARFIGKTSGARSKGAETDAKKEDAGDGVEVEAEWRKVLPPETKGAFIPWPAHEVIRHGALGAIQGMRERGVEPGDVTRSAEEEERDKAEREAGEEREREELERVGREVEEARRVERERRRGEEGRDGGERRVEDEFDPDEM